MTGKNSEYLRLLLAGDRNGATKLVDSAINQGMSLNALYHDVFWECQKELGQLWESGRINIAQEHLATSITIDQMARLRMRAISTTPHYHRVVVTTLPGDVHGLGAQMVADLLAFDGWDVDFLGTETPVADLVDLIANRKPSLLALSIGLPRLLPLAKEAIASVRACSNSPKVLVGGRVVDCTDDQVEELGADGAAINAVDAIKVARRLVGLDKTDYSLDEMLKTLGLRVQAARKCAKLSQKELGQKSGLDRTYISAVENGKQNISIRNLWRIAQVLGIALDDLLC